MITLPRFSRTFFVSTLLLAIVLCFSYCVALSAEPSTDNESVDFDASPMIYAKTRAPIIIEINGEPKEFPAEYAVPAEFDKKGGNVVFLYPTTVFVPRKPGESCQFKGNFDSSVKEELRKYLETDPRLRVVHRVQYDQKNDDLKALFKIQFYPDQFKLCVDEVVRTNASDQNRTGGANYSPRTITFFEEGYAPQLEFRLNNGIEDRDFENFFTSDPDLLAYRVFQRGQNYSGAQDVWVTFRALESDDETSSPFVAFRSFCENSEFVRAQLVYYYKAKSSGTVTSNSTLKFSNIQKFVNDLKAENIASDDGMPIVDRSKRDEYCEKINAALTQDVVIDSNGDPEARALAIDCFRTQGALMNGALSTLIFRQVRYEDGNEYDDVLKKYLEPIITTKLTDKIDHNERLTEEQKSKLKSSLTDLNIVRDKQTQGMFKFSKGPFGVGGSAMDFLGIDYDTRDALVQECVDALREITSNATQTTENEIKMDCKDFVLYKVNLGGFEAQISAAQNFFITRNGLARDVTVAMPLDFTTEVLNSSDPHDLHFYKRNYEILKLLYEAVRQASVPGFKYDPR